MAEPHDTQEPDELSLGGPPSLDPIGREIARMKIGDALFAKSEAQAVAREPKPMWRWRALLVGALVIAIGALAIVFLR